jgi:LacI family transcriptional regulator
MKQFSTLKNLAQKLGLSVSTVSRALKDHPDISPATRLRVKELAELTEYEPNTFAVNLRTNKSKILGVIVPRFQNLFYEYFIAALDEEASRRGYSLLVLQSGESAETELKNLAIMKMNRVDGLFISVTENANDIKHFLKLSEAGIPIIFFDRVPQFEACDKICFDDADAAALAAKQLIASGRKNILCLFWGSRSLSINQKRAAAFKAEFDTHSPGTVLDIHFETNLAAVEQITLQALSAENRPDAVFCNGDNILIAAMKAIRAKQLAIPGDIGIITISNGFIPTLYNPAITFVETNGSGLGKLAFTRLMEIFDGKTFVRELKIEPTVTAGGSL